MLGLPPKAAKAAARTAAAVPELRRDLERPAQDPPGSIWMKVTAFDEDTGLYAWKEQHFTTAGDFYDMDGGRSGTVNGLEGATRTWNPAREFNDGTVSAFPFYVKGWPSAEIDGDDSGSGSGSGSGSDGTPNGMLYYFAVGGGGDSSFLAVLTHKTYSGTSIRYTAYHVTETEGGQITYTLGALVDQHVYQARNLDLAVWDPATALDPTTPDPLSVVRLFQGAGDYLVFQEEPWTDIFRIVDDSDADGQVAAHRYLDQNDSTWKDGREVRVINAE